MPVAVALSPYSVRYHRPDGFQPHRAWCGVRAAVFDEPPDGDLEPCGVCWPDAEPSLSPWDRLQRQCRYWDALGAWEGQGATTERHSGQDSDDTGRSR